ncbi:MAG TPA: polymer-forming cytoskeletal protein [Methylomirabilota bacterium]|nr:polymer-forming cytoskeletal protein [Methylomirabilota bacterium]
MLKFRSQQPPEEPQSDANTVIGVNSNFRGTLMVTGTLRIDGEFEGDILNCDRLEIGEHGIMRADVEVKDALIMGRVYGNIRALGSIEMKAGARVEGDVAALTVAMEQGVRFTGRCTMLEAGIETTIEVGSGMRR